MKNKKHKQFADEYLVDFNATQAAIRAGYSQKTAYSQGQRLLKNVEIKAYIQAEQDKSSETLKITREDILQDLLEIKDNNKTEGTVNSLKAIEIINKMLGYYAADKKEITISEQPLFSDDEEDE